MKKRVFNVMGTLAVLTVSVLVFMLFSSMRKQPERKQATIQQQIVPTVTVKNSPVQIILPVNGKTTASEKITVYSEVSGILESSRKPFLAGETFSRGDTLLTINSDEYEASLKSAKVALYTKFAQILPELKYSYSDNYTAWLNYFRNFSMYDTMMTLPEPKTEQEKLYIAGQGIYASYYSILSQETRRAKYVITAPFDGMVTASNIKPGTLVISGQSLGTYMRPGTYEMEVSLTETDAGFVQIGDAVALSTGSGKSCSGTVIRKSAAINTSSQSVSAFIEIKDPGILEGEYLSGSIQTGTTVSGVIVPNKYLNNNGTLYVLGDSTVNEIPANVFQSFDEFSVVTDLADNIRIVTRSQGVYAGMPAVSVDKQ